jgi:hypothetical protein
MSHTTAELFRTSSNDDELQSLLREPTSVLLGVSQPAAQTLTKHGIRTVFDLATSQLFWVARHAMDVAHPETGNLRLDRPPGDLLDDDTELDSLDEIRKQPLAKLRMLSDQEATELSTALDVNSIQDLANWPPARAAHHLLQDRLGSDVEYEDLAAESLRPRMGEYPTERFFYKTLVMLDTADSPTATDLTGPVDLEDMLALPQRFEKPAVGALLTFSQSWFAAGVTLGQMLHSLALAPGEATRIALIDWSRKTSASATEDITEREILTNAARHSRALSEVQNAVSNDFQEGGSTATSGGFSSSASGAATESSGLLGSLFDGDSTSNTSQSAFSTSIAQTSSWSRGSRDVLATMTQQVNDVTEQHATNVRNRRATAVREVSQEEHENVSTRIVANYNHMHALTIQYYEVVQVYRVQARLHKADRIFFIPLELLDFHPTDLAKGMRVVERFRKALIRAALSRKARSLLFDDETAVALRPMVPVQTPRRSREAPILGRNTVRAGGFWRTSVLSTEPVYHWDERAVGKLSQRLDRPLFRPGGVELHLPDDMELREVTFEGVDASGLRIELRVPDATITTTLDTVEGTLLVRLPSPIRLSEIDALYVRKESGSKGKGTISLRCSYSGRNMLVPPIPVDLKGGIEQKVLALESDRPRRQKELLEHLQDNREHYSHAVFRHLDAEMIASLLARFRWKGASLQAQVEPRPIRVAGNYLVFRAPVDANESSGVAKSPSDDLPRPPHGLPPDVVTPQPKTLTWSELLDDRGLDFDARDDRFVPICTEGVFAEAVLGRSNAAEKLDITRFWNWQDSPTPLQPPEIGAVATGSRGTTEDLEPGQLSPQGLQVQNQALPDPSGLAVALQALSNMNFRDMSGTAGTQGLAQAAGQGTLDAATAAARAASENLRTEAEKAVAMGRIAADIAKSAMGTGGGSGALAGAGAEVMKGISSDGARINYGKEMNERSAETVAPGGGSPSPGTSITPPTSSNGHSSAGFSGSAGPSPPPRNFEKDAFDVSTVGYAPGATAELVSASMPVPAAEPGSGAITDEEKRNAILEVARQEYDLNDEQLDIVSKAATYVSIADHATDAAVVILELAGIVASGALFTAAGVALSVAGILATPIGALIDIAYAYQSTKMRIAMRAYAHGVTSWAFEHDPPPLSETMRDRVREWDGDDAIPPLETAWTEAVLAAREKMEAATAGDAIKAARYRALLRAVGNGDAIELARALMQGMGQGLTDLELEIWTANYNTVFYPN